MADENINLVKEEIEYQTFANFLEGTPPNQQIHISDLIQNHYEHDSHLLKTPEIHLHCVHEKCNGIRFFRYEKDFGPMVYSSKPTYFYLTYICSNCQSFKKVFSLAAQVISKGMFQGVCQKIGELPTYGPPVPSKLIKLIGPDRDDFLKGRRCENQGLGVGAFIYYRRVVENQKDRIIGEIIKVSKKIDAPKEMIKKLEESIKETQFSKSLELAKDAMPESLLIDGHSPITLLHGALSKGVHLLTDEKCLELAGSVRIVLGELSDRLSQALKEEAELTKALSILMNKKDGYK